jgi:hypothetical protein
MTPRATRSSAEMTSMFCTTIGPALVGVVSGPDTAERGANNDT